MPVGANPFLPRYCIYMAKSNGELDKLEVIASIKRRVLEYCANFEARSNGYQLPNIEYLGSLQNSHKMQSKFLIAIPIKNQETAIQSILQSLERSVSFVSTLGIFLDNCTDQSKEKVFEYFSNTSEKREFIAAVHIFSSDGEIFESTCENLIFTLVDAEFFMSLQSDIYLNDDTFQELAVAAFNQIGSLFSLSGRAIVKFRKFYEVSLINQIFNFFIKVVNTTTKIFLKKVFLFGFKFHGQYFGDTSYHGDNVMTFFPWQKETVYLGEANIRGPIVWRASFFKELGGFNDVAYYLGRDECDISLRAWTKYEWRSGYLPSRSYSVPAEGTTRKKRSQEVLEQMQLRETLSKKFPGTLTNLWDSTSTNSITFPKNKKIRLVR